MYGRHNKSTAGVCSVSSKKFVVSTQFCLLLMAATSRSSLQLMMSNLTSTENKGTAWSFKAFATAVGSLPTSMLGGQGLFMTTEYCAIRLSSSAHLQINKRCFLETHSLLVIPLTLQGALALLPNKCCKEKVFCNDFKGKSCY